MPAEKRLEVALSTRPSCALDSSTVLCRSGNPAKFAEMASIGNAPKRHAPILVSRVDEGREYLRQETLGKPTLTTGRWGHAGQAAGSPCPLWSQQNAH
jgi:hypothetical protein